MPGQLAERLEALSAYQPVFAPHDPSAALNPIVFSHHRLTLGGKVVSVLSRIGPAGLDYSGRPNKYAHHVVLEGDQRPAGGPAWLLAQPGFMQSAWEGDPREIPARPAPQGDRPAGVARAWQSLCGDGGWAGVLAESFLADPKRPVLLLFRPGMDLLPLFVEALALLPPARRWEVDFSTYFTQLPQGVSCAWRGGIEGSAEAENARRLPSALFVDLSKPIGRAAGGALVHLARTGERSAEQPDSAILPPDLGRHVPRIPREKAGTAGNPSGRGPGPIRPAVPGNYDLLPELARLATGAGTAKTKGGASARRRRRTMRLTLAVLAACLIPFAAMGYFFFKVGRSPIRQLSAFSTVRPHGSPRTGDLTGRQAAKGDRIAERADKLRQRTRPPRGHRLP